MKSSQEKRERILKQVTPPVVAVLFRSISDAGGIAHSPLHNKDAAPSFVLAVIGFNHGYVLQIDFYFSDSNLPFDRFLKGECQAEGGCAILCQCRLACGC